MAVCRQTDSRAETAGKGHRAGPIGPDQREQVMVGGPLFSWGSRERGYLPVLEGGGEGRRQVPKVENSC